MISLAKFRSEIEALEGQRLETQQRRQGFVVRIFQEGPEYIPESSGEPRPDTWASVQRVLDRYNELGSFSPKDYHDLTYHSSYILALLKRVISSEQEPEVPVVPSGVASLGPPVKAGRRQNKAQAEMTEASAHSSSSPDKPHQRVGSVSNAHVGSDFEAIALEYFRGQGIELRRNYPIELGLSHKKVRQFDLGADDPKILVECKSHTWTAGARVPQAKMTVWNEAMYYFHLAPPGYRKVLFVLHNRREKGGEALLAYYKRTYAHLIPDDVEFLEWDENTGDIVRI